MELDLSAADIEIAQLRREEAYAAAQMREFDRLLSRLLPHWSCDFVLAHIPDGAWVALPPVDGRPVMLHGGWPPRDRKGFVGVSMGTLRAMAKGIPA